MTSPDADTKDAPPPRACAAETNCGTIVDGNVGVENAKSEAAAAAMRVFETFSCCVGCGSEFLSSVRLARVRERGDRPVNDSRGSDRSTGVTGSKNAGCIDDDMKDNIQKIDFGDCRGIV